MGRNAFSGNIPVDVNEAPAPKVKALPLDILGGSSAVIPSLITFLRVAQVTTKNVRTC